MNAPVIRIEMPGGRPPSRVLTGLPAGGSPHLLDALGLEGWGTGPGGDGAAIGLLALEPEVVFEGGFAALQEARRWLDHARAAAPLAAVLMGRIGYELGAELAGERVPRPSDPWSAPVWLAEIGRAHV